MRVVQHLSTFLKKKRKPTVLFLIYSVYYKMRMELITQSKKI